MLAEARGLPLALTELTIGEQLRQTGARFPDRVALISRHQQRRFTWAELDQAVTEYAEGLLGLGLQPGDRVGCWSTNCFEWILLQLGCARAGLILVNVNPAYRSHELKYVIRKSQMKALFLWRRDVRTHFQAIFEEAAAETSPIYFDDHVWTARVPVTHACDRHDAVNIQYTSGTTGSPKGVLLTHRNILNNGLIAGRQLQLTEADKINVAVPLYHCFGCVGAVMPALIYGATMVLPNATFDAEATLIATAAEGCTVLYGVPTMFIAQLEHPRFASFDLSTLRTGIMAGAPCPIELMKRVVSQMHCRDLTIGYGQTEASPLITMSSVDDPLDVRVSTVGATLPETEVKIVDPNNGSTVARGVQGELCARGYLIMLGYDGEEDATRRAVDADGWLHTGDLAVMREDGNCKITGRARDLIIRGGENIYPREIEEFLFTHPAVADAQVFGVPDEKYGEAVAAWIRLRAPLTEEELLAWCKSQIAHYKVPRYVTFVESYPMTVTGKIQKFRMRQDEIQARGLELAARVETA
jgi:fatty-acyl-CoA synthase